MEMMAVIGWKMTWSEQAEAWVKEEEAWIVASPARPSPVGPQLGRASWLEVFFQNPFQPEKKSLLIGDPLQSNWGRPSHRRDPQID